ncbi:MAG: thiol-disulfide oxidoreductase DCC family protein [Candidatus Rhabdochlamydia sp.]
MNKKQFEESPRVFYDGTCGLCHFFVRFTLLRMQTPFIFSPIGGKTFCDLVKDKKIEDIPDSIMVYDKKWDEVYFKTEAIIYILRSLGKGWKYLAYLIRYIPLGIANACYDFIAKIRSKIFKKPETACPVIPQNLRKFFKD